VTVERSVSAISMSPSVSSSSSIGGTIFARVVREGCVAGSSVWEMCVDRNSEQIWIMLIGDLSNSG